MTTLLAGIHDREGARIVPPGGWCVDTVALVDKPLGTDYPALNPDINWIVRLNWGYGSTGTIPDVHDHGTMATRAAWYVNESRGCHRWIIGNEPNHSQEWPGGRMISPGEYARCFVLVREAIRRVQPHAQVIPAPVAPYNAEAGDWLDYGLMCLTAIGRGGFDGFALHSYIQHADPALVNSEATMDPPFQDRRFQFNAYRDTLARVPAWARNLPVYLTEANPLDGWQARGIMPAMLANVQEWNNRADTQKIHAVVFYRYPDYDKWGMASRPDVQAEFQAAAPRYPAPTAQIAQPDPEKTTLNLPAVPVGNPTPVPDRDIDPRLTDRGVAIQAVDVRPGQTYWRVVRGEWLDESQAGGRHHIYIDALDEQGQRVPGAEFVINWPNGSAIIRTEAKPGEPWAANYPMSPSRNEFSVLPGGELGDMVSGIGMGADTPGGFNAGIHTSTGLVFQRVRAPQVAQAPSDPPKPAPVAPVVPTLVHPVQDPDHRRITQPFGVNPQRYARFNLDGHNGVDFATPNGTAICAVAAGVPVEVGNDPHGYGLYVKLRHGWGETLYAHLSQQLCEVGKPLLAGETLGLSGNTGNSTGPHLHFGLRINPYTRGRPFDGYRDPLPYLQGKPASPGEIVSILRAGAREFGLSEALLLSLAWAESSFNPAARSPAGALGLMQIMPGTWDEWATRVGAVDILYPRDNARVGAAYLDWCIRQAGGVYRGLLAYNWGIGHLLAGKEIPQETATYAAKVLHGRDLLEAVNK